ncbi:ABC transporter substrate-binding protein [Mangrovicoccus sp. HB161399]|uniref:ABC transporter substrate-binding protein n=1 Tax=Mangrovicoccus sp. HB161399 TaxID=2720392 RepID=UPI001556E345|nr:ABC transporter substrate-binding protein [Mangrovicoccus sp. HB161399]
MNATFLKSRLAGTAAGIALATMAALPLSAADLDDVTFALPSSTVLPYHGFIFLGIPAGFYEDLGLDADVERIQGSAAAVQLVASGDVDMAHIGLSALIAAKKSQPDLPVKAVFLQDIAPIYSIAIPKGTGISSPADLKGKKLGVLSLSSGAVPWAKAYLAKEGLSEDDYEIVAIGSGAQAYSLLKSGEVDAISFSRGLSAALEILGADFEYYAPDEPSGVIVANTDFLAEHPDIATRALEGVVLNQTFMEINPEAATRYFWDYVSKPAGISEEEALKQGVTYITRTAAIWKDYQDTSRDWGRMTDGTWTGLMEFGPIAASFDNEDALGDFVASLYTNELIDGVNEVDLSIAEKAAAE